MKKPGFNGMNAYVVYWHSRKSGEQYRSYVVARNLEAAKNHVKKDVGVKFVYDDYRDEGKTDLKSGLKRHD